MNDLLNEMREPSEGGEGANSATNTRKFSSRAYDKATTGFPDVKKAEAGSAKRHQANSKEINSDYRPGLARPHINRGANAKVREIAVEDDDIPELRRQQGYSKNRNHAEEMEKMMTVLHQDVMGKGSIDAARVVHAASSAERTDELSLQISCIPLILKKHAERDASKRSEIPIITIPRYITLDRIDDYCKTSTYIEAASKLKRLLFAKRIQRKAPSNSTDNFQNVMQLVYPRDELPSLQDFMYSAQNAMELLFTHLYVADKALGSVSVTDVYDNKATFCIGKCALIFMSMNERSFGLYVLCQLYYEPKHRMKEMEEGDLVPRIAAARHILNDDPSSRGSNQATDDAINRTHELLTRYFSKDSMVKCHNATYNDIYGDGTTDRSPLGALLESSCFRAQFLDAGFIPAVE